jgi:hypothetical protein
MNKLMQIHTVDFVATWLSFLYQEGVWTEILLNGFWHAHLIEGVTYKMSPSVFLLPGTISTMICTHAMGLELLGRKDAMKGRKLSQAWHRSTHGLLGSYKARAVSSQERLCDSNGTQNDGVQEQPALCVCSPKKVTPRRDAMTIVWTAH